MDYSEPVAQLLALGEPDWEDWADYRAMGIGPEQTGDLVRMAQDEELGLSDSETPEVWAPVHAWRALGQLRAEEAIGPLLGLLRRVDEEEDEWVMEDLPIVLGRIGPAAVPEVGAYLADPKRGLWARSVASRALAEVGELHPDARGACLAALAQALEGYADNDPALNGSIVSDLIDLHGVEAAPIMEAAFAAHSVDLFVAGDWEDAQIELGLLAERTTPRPGVFGTSRGSGGSDDDLPWSMLGDGRRPAHRADKKRKAKRKQQKEARRKQRKRRT